MESEKLKISIAQRISDDRLLEKISNLLGKENIVGYDTHGNPISEKVYFKDINSALLEFREGTTETYTPEEVKSRILGE